MAHNTKTDQKSKTPTKVPSIPTGGVRPSVQLTPNMRLTESIKPSKHGFTTSVKETLKRIEIKK